MNRPGGVNIMRITERKNEMATETYLGAPPRHVIDWIKSHSKPAAREKTLITFTDGTSQEYDWSGDIKLGSLPVSDTSDFFDWNTYTWTKHPKIVNLGTKVTGIDDSMF